jgi:plastocyanin
MAYVWVGLLALLLSGASGSGAGAPSVEVAGSATFKDKPLADAVVWVDAPDSRQDPGPEVILDQRNLSFSPHVLAVRVGTTVSFPNHDRVFHDVFSFRDGKRFELGLYPVGAIKHVPFDRAGLSRVFCNIHPGMAAYIIVVDTSHFAVTDRDGNFSLPNVPAGTYPYHAWRPGGPILNGSADIRAGSRLDVQWH